MKLLNKLKSSFAFNILGSIVLFMIVFGVTVSAIGYYSFTDSFKREYSDTTFHMAQTAAASIDGNRIDDYLIEKGDARDFRNTKQFLDNFCVKMNLSLVYVIKVDTSDYGSFTSIFNSVGTDTPYSPWELGYQRETSNEEYALIYQQIYNKLIDHGTVYRTTNLGSAPPHITTLVPVKDDNDNVTALLCIQRPMQELVDGRRPYLINVAIADISLAFIACVLISYYILRQFITPIRKIIKEAKRFSAENSKGEKLGADISRIEEISDLATSIDKMEVEMLDYIDNLTSVTAERERIGAELSLAAAIQENSLPNVFPAFPDRIDFDIYASMSPAKEVGGDFYSFFLVDDDHLAISIGDVSGKGVPAALFMMVTNILINEGIRIAKSPAEVLTAVNQRICEHNRADMFVTVWLGVLELSSGRLIAANAGHEDPAVMRKDGNFELIRSKHGLVIGAMEGIRYRDIEIRLCSGDKIFIYTDGVPEATDVNDQMFTLDRMIESLNRDKDKSPQEIIEGIKASVNKFVGDAPQFDDLTVLCVELKEDK